jgi:hypothetical protein
MKRIAFLLFAALTMACFVVSFSPASGTRCGRSCTDLLLLKFLPDTGPAAHERTAAQARLN